MSPALRSPSVIERPVLGCESMASACFQRQSWSRFLTNSTASHWVPRREVLSFKFDSPNGRGAPEEPFGCETGFRPVTEQHPVDPCLRSAHARESILHRRVCASTGVRLRGPPETAAGCARLEAYPTTGKQGEHYTCQGGGSGSRSAFGGSNTTGSFRRRLAIAARRGDFEPVEALMEGAATMAANPKTVEDVFKDFSSRRKGMLKALTSDVEDFYKQCDPEKENLCLYGFPNESWEVNLPAEEVPPELPEPALGINFARDGMQKKDWLALVAVHSDAWLLAVAFYYGARFDKNERKRLFNLINDLPTLFDIVTGKKPAVEKAAGNSAGATNKGKAAGKARSGEVQSKPEKKSKQEAENDEDEDEEEHGETLCGICGGLYGANEFWIGCDHCDKWYHGKCVKITPAKADHIKDYKCPSCTKRART